MLGFTKFDEGSDCKKMVDTDIKQTRIRVTWYVCVFFIRKLSFNYIKSKGNTKEVFSLWGVIIKCRQTHIFSITTNIFFTKRALKAHFDRFPSPNFVNSSCIGFQIIY